jgi:hypothetical protein
MSTTSTTPLTSIAKWEGPRLAGSANFSVWRQYIISLTVGAEVHYIIQDVDVPNSSAVSKRRDTKTDIEKAEEQVAKAADEKERLKHTRWLWALLFNSLEPSVAMRLSSAASDPVDANAVTMWKELHERYDRTKGIRAAQLQQELLTMRLKPGGNVEHHFHRMRDVYNRIIVSYSP